MREYRAIDAERSMVLLRQFVDDAIFQNLVEWGSRRSPKQPPRRGKRFAFSGS